MIAISIARLRANPLLSSAAAQMRTNKMRKGGRYRPVMCLPVLAVLLVAGGAAWAESVAGFADYPGAAGFSGRNAAPILATREARMFRTMIREGAREKPNFDGHYIVATWGCGTDCEMGAIIDAVSGKVVSLPAVAGSAEDAGLEATHFDYHLDSRLLVMAGMINEEPPMGAHYFEFDGAKLKPIKTTVKPERHKGSTPNEKAR
jgi:hypothetical protein